MLFLKNQKGQGLVEYLIIMALMAVGTMAIVRVLSQTVEVKFAKVTEALQGRKASANLQMSEIQTSHVKKKDMSDFFNGSVTHANGEDRETD